MIATELCTGTVQAPRACWFSASRNESVGEIRFIICCLISFSLPDPLVVSNVSQIVVIAFQSNSFGRNQSIKFSMRHEQYMAMFYKSLKRHFHSNPLDYTNWFKSAWYICWLYFAIWKSVSFSIFGIAQRWRRNVFMTDERCCCPEEWKRNKVFSLTLNMLWTREHGLALSSFQVLPTVVMVFFG